jgi:hypothetical protein
VAAQLAKTWPDHMEQTTEPKSAAYKYYVLRHTDGEFRIIYMEAADAALWKAAGWEFRAYDSNEEARVALIRWQTSVVGLRERELDTSRSYARSPERFHQTGPS